MTKKVAKKKVAKKRAGNTKIYTVQEVLDKYNLTPEEFQDLAQSINGFASHIKGNGITIAGLMSIGKAVKGRVKKATEVKVEAEANAPVIRMLEISHIKPPNNTRLYGIDHIKDENGVVIDKVKVVINVKNRFHEGAKGGVWIECEKINDRLFAHPPLERL